MVVADDLETVIADPHLGRHPFDVKSQLSDVLRLSSRHCQETDLEGCEFCASGNLSTSLTEDYEYGQIHVERVGILLL